MEKKQVEKRLRLVVIGGSSGSLDALFMILPALKPHFNIPILLVLHRGQTPDNSLVELLAAKSSLQVKEADEKEMLRAGWMYVAPADYHLLLEKDGSVSLDASEKVHYCRPSIEVSFISAAAAYKKNCIAILLSGANADGARAMTTIKENGGLNIVQDPDEAWVGFMPGQAILLSPIDHILPAKEIAALLNKLSEE